MNCRFAHAWILSTVAAASAVVLWGGTIRGAAPAAPGGSFAPIAERLKLLPSDGTPGDRFGQAIAVSGTLAAVGAPEAAGTGGGFGAVYLFDTVTGAELAKLSADDADMNFFGGSVALDGSVLIVGCGANSSCGRVFVYDAVSGLRVRTLQPEVPTPADRFGSTVAVHGTTVLVGDWGNETWLGAAYVFDAVTGEQLHKLVADEPEHFTYFGQGVDVHGTTALVGADGEGAAYLFDTTTGEQTARLVPNDGEWTFGWAVSLDGHHALVGTLDGVGAYLFDLSTGLQTAKLDQPADLGFSTDLAAGLALTFTYAFEAGTAEGLGRFAHSDAEGYDAFGWAVATDGATVVVGAPEDDDNGPGSGSAYVFAAPARFPTFCDGADGSLASCPCANPGAPETGCDLVQETGGVGLAVLGQTTAPKNAATLRGTGFPLDRTPTAIVIRGDGLDPAGPVVFGDGLRCIATPCVRLAATFASGGVSMHTFGHAPSRGSGQFAYQLWFRNTPAFFCDPAAAFNLSSGGSLTW